MRNCHGEIITRLISPEPPRYRVSCGEFVADKYPRQAPRLFTENVDASIFANGIIYARVCVIPDRAIDRLDPTD